MWRRRSPSPRQLRFAWLTELVRAIHAASRGTYGWRRVNAELTYGHGVIVNRKTVRKIMRIQGLHGLPGSRKTIRGKATMATAADLVERQFARPAPDQLWVTDITEHPTREGKVYCCVVMDVSSRRVVGWSIDSHQATPLVTNALGMAINHRNPGLIKVQGGIIPLNIQTREGCLADPAVVDAQAPCPKQAEAVLEYPDGRTVVIRGAPQQVERRVDLATEKVVAAERWRGLGYLLVAALLVEAGLAAIAWQLVQRGRWRSRRVA